MNSFRRLSTRISASISWLASQVENHEALVNSAIVEMQNSAAKAKAQLKRVKQDGERLVQRIEELKQADALWQERALKIAASDEAKALECLKRQKRAKAELGQLLTQKANHQKAEEQLNQDLRIIEQRFSELKTQRNLLRTRQSRAEAQRAIAGCESSVLCEIDDIFERWESKVNECEYQGSSLNSNSDSLESDFVSAEETSELKAALAALQEQRSSSAEIKS